jgi:uncharacterized membrane protein
VARPLSWILTIGSLLWALAIVLTPLAAREGTVSLPAAFVYAGASLVCHQRPERTFHLDGLPWAVCARCAGLYGAAAAGALCGWLGVPRIPRGGRTLLAIAAIPTAATLIAELSGAWAPGNIARAIAALPLGGAAAWLCIRALRAEIAQRDAI